MANCMITESQALIEAIKERKLKLVKILVDGGADVNSWDEKRRTTLMFVCYKRCASQEDSENVKEKIMQILLENGADPNVEDIYGRTTLMYANFFQASEKIKLMLIEYGAKMDKLSKFPFTMKQTKKIKRQLSFEIISDTQIEDVDKSTCIGAQHQRKADTRRHYTFDTSQEDPILKMRRNGFRQRSKTDSNIKFRLREQPTIVLQDQKRKEYSPQRCDCKLPPINPSGSWTGPTFPTKSRSRCSSEHSDDLQEESVTIIGKFRTRSNTDGLQSMKPNPEQIFKLKMKKKWASFDRMTELSTCDTSMEVQLGEESKSTTVLKLKLPSLETLTLSCA